MASFTKLLHNCFNLLNTLPRLFRIVDRQINIFFLRYSLIFTQFPFNCPCDHAFKFHSTLNCFNFLNLANVHRPSYILQIIRNHDDFQMGDNQELMVIHTAPETAFKSRLTVLEFAPQHIEQISVERVILLDNVQLGVESARSTNS